MYKIFNSKQAFIDKNNEIIKSGVCGNAIQYANADECKHPTKNLWAMPVLNYAQSFFDPSELKDSLSSDWENKLKKT